MLVYLTMWLKSVMTCLRQAKALKMNEVYARFFLFDFSCTIWWQQKGQELLDTITPFNDFDKDDDILFDAIQSYRKLLKAD